MSASARYAFLKIKGIGAVGQHLAVVVGFDDEMSGLPHERSHLVGELSGIGDEAKGGRRVAVSGRKEAFACFGTNQTDEIAVVFAGIVRHSERRDAEITHFKRRAGRGVALVGGHHLFGHEAVALHAFVYGRRGVDGNVKFCRNGTHGFDVVGVVVGDDDGADRRDSQAIVAQVLFESSDADAEIDENGRSERFKIVAVAGASASEAYKFHV